LIVRQTTLSFSNHFMYIIIHTNLILCFWLFELLNRARATHLEWRHCDALLLSLTGLTELKAKTALLEHQFTPRSSSR
jgi:hypothetical protein